MKLPLLVSLLAAILNAQSGNLLIGRVIRGDVNDAPIPNITILLVNTGARKVTDSGGRFQFALPEAFTPGSELQIVVEQSNLRLDQPPNGYLILPRPGSRPLECRVLPKGTRALIKPEVLLSQAASQSALSVAKDSDPSKGREPSLRRYLRDWASEYGFSLEDVETEVKKWADEVREKRGRYSERQRALAEFQSRNYDEAQRLFESSAASALSEVERMAAEEKTLQVRRQAALRRYLEDKEAAARAARDGMHFGDALKILTAALPNLPRSKYPKEWAEIQFHLGLTQSLLGEAGEPAFSITALQSAVQAYTQVVEVYTRASMPDVWARTQNQLGTVYRRLGERLTGPEGQRYLQRAVQTYSRALQVYRRELRPRDWATTQDNLGDAYGRLGERMAGAGAQKTMEQAVQFYMRALEVRTRESQPWDWAATQNNLGVVYAYLGDLLAGEEGRQILEKAVQASKGALEVYTRESAPLDWAAMESNLGIVYQRLGERIEGVEGEQKLEQAAECYRTALEVYTRESLPQGWAMTQFNLGIVYGIQGARLPGHEAQQKLEKSIQAFVRALEVRTRQSLPRAWVLTQNKLATAYMTLGLRLAGGERRRKMEVAVEILESVLEVDKEDRTALGMLSQLYGDETFDFAKAFAINERRVAAGDGLLDFTENHLTTARFAECARRAESQLSGTDSEAARFRPALAVMRFACLAADQGLAAAIRSGQEVLANVPAKPTGWSFRGTIHFLGESPAFADHRDDWVKLFAGLEEADGAAMRSALQNLGVQ